MRALFFAAIVAQNNQRANIPVAHLLDCFVYEIVWGKRVRDFFLGADDLRKRAFHAMNVLPKPRSSVIKYFHSQSN